MLTEYRNISYSFIVVLRLHLNAAQFVSFDFTERILLPGEVLEEKVRRKCT